MEPRREAVNRTSSLSFCSAVLSRKESAAELCNGEKIKIGGFAFCLAAGGEPTRVGKSQAQIFVRVDRDVIDAYLVVKMRTGRATT